MKNEYLMNTRTMTFKQFFFVSLAVAGLVTGCAGEDTLTESGERTPVVFYPHTRTVFDDNNKTFWKEDDAVGVFMVKAGGAMPADIVDGVNNKLYTVSDAVTGTLVPADGQSIYYPKSEAVDFVAYYPYVSTPDYLLDLDVNDQTTAEKQAAVNCVYSNNARNIGGSEEAVALCFHHLLAKVKLNITLGEGLVGGSVTGVMLSGMPQGVKFDMRNGTINQVVPPSDTQLVSSLKLAEASSGADVTFTALVVPQGAGIYAGRKIHVTVNGETYSGDIPDTDAYDGNVMYVYPVTVHRNGVAVGNMSITDWNNIDYGTDGTTEILNVL